MKSNQEIKLSKDKSAIIGVDFILAAILILIISAMAIAIVFPMIAGSTSRSQDINLATALGKNTTAYRPMANASLSLLTTTGTTLGLAPMMALAAVAAGIISILLFAFGSVTRQGL